MRVRRFFISLLVLVGQMFSQENGFRVSGRVTDLSGATVASASITFYNRFTSQPYRTTADSQGAYSVALSRGQYLVQAEAPGLTLLNAPATLDLKGTTEFSLQLGISKVESAMEVTATGTLQSLSETAKAVDVVSRQELERRGVESAADGLREIAGVRVEQRGGPGFNTTIQIRGLRTFDTAVLIDGMRFRDVGATQGDASSFLTDLLLVDTARIEVLRGAGSSLYGTNAIGGAINLVTDAGGGPLHGSLTANGGGLGSFRGLASLAGDTWQRRLHYSAGTGHQDVTNGVGGFGRYRNTTGNGLIDYSVRPGLIVSARLLATDAYGQLYAVASAAPAATLPSAGILRAIAPPDSQIRLAEQRLPYALGGATLIPALGDPDYSRTAQFVSTLLTLQQQVSAPFAYRLSYQALLSNRNVINGPQGAGSQPAYLASNQYNGRIDTARAQANFLAGDHHLLSAGYEFEREFFDSPATDNNPNPDRRINSRSQASERSNTLDVQDQIRLLRDRLQISLSGRLQHFELDQPRFTGTVPVYGAASTISPPNAYTADASAAYFLRASGTKIRVHGGNGYRKPSLYELFGTTFSGSAFTAYGDPRLRPERSIAIDGGFDQYFASDRLRLGATYFYTRLQQVIAFDSTGLIQPATDPFGRSSGYRNTGGAMARGVELSAELKPRRSTMVKASYTYTNARDRFSQFVDGTLQTPRITPNSFSMVLLQEFGRHIDASFDLTESSDYLYQLSRRTFLFPGRHQAAVSAGYSRQLGERLKARLYTRVNNLTDQTYYEDGFRTPGLWATAGVTVSF